MEGMNEYDLIKQQAAQTNNMVSQNLRQRMMDAGISSTPLTLQNNDEMGGRGNIAAIDTQQQAVTDYRNALSNQNAGNLAAQNIGAEAANMAYQSEKDLNDANTLYDTLYDLWKSRKLTAKQFKQKTGLNVTEWPRGRGGSGGGVNDPNSWFGDSTGAGVNPADLVYDPTYGQFRKKG